MPVQTGSTSLHFAVENNHADTVELLIKCYADVDAKNKVHCTIIIYLCNSSFTSLTLNDHLFFEDL